MNLKNNFYLKRLLRENFYYLVTFIMVIVLFVIVNIAFTNDYTANKDKTNQTKTDIENLNQRKTVLESMIFSNYQEVKNFNIILNSLIPDSEDFFSIIYALERISQQTNFVVTNYSIDLAQSSGERLTLSIAGDGDTNAFLKFLENYNFSSGRLITMNDYDFTNKGIQFKITLNFYNKKVSTEQVKLDKLKEEDLNMMREIAKKVDFLLKTPVNGQPQSQQAAQEEKFDYKTTQDLF